MENKTDTTQYADKEQDTQEDNKSKTIVGDILIRLTSLIIIIGVVISDYLGYKSQYSSFILGGAATIYIFGRKGLMLILGKYSGYSLDEIDKFFKH